MQGALPLRLLAALCGALLLLMTLLALTLDGLATESERDLREGRYAYILAQLKQRVEAPLSLGLQVQSLDYLQRLLEQEAAADPDILSIDLFDAQGAQLFTTDTADIRQVVPESWLQEVQALSSTESEQAPRARAYWLADERDGRVLGVALHNDFGLLVGGLALRHHVSDVGEALVSSGTLLFLLVAGGATLLGAVGFWQIGRPLDREAETLITAARDQEQASQVSGGAAALGQDGARLLRALQQAERQCDSATAEVERIDGRS